MYVKVDVLQGQAEWAWKEPKRLFFLFFFKEGKKRGILGLIRVDWGAGFLQNVNEFYQQWTGINDVLLGYECVLAVESKDQLPWACFYPADTVESILLLSIRMDYSQLVL